MSAPSNASNSGMRAANAVQLPPSVHTLSAQFREIHKNTWLKRLTAEGKKITVGPKKSERSWVVFCVHDDTEAMLEGYAEPRQAPAHSPEWIVSLRHTLHVSHALIPNSHEFEFVVALNNEVVRFHATSWEIMQEWVETLRAKLREMKILSPRENLYTKLPEVRMPLLPTRDPTSPLPAPPPVPAALVPGVERVIPHTVPETTSMPITTLAQTTVVGIITATTTTTTTTLSAMTVTCDTATTSTSHNANTNIESRASATIVTQTTPKATAMSNTLTQNLLNMLTDPISAYSENLNATLEQTDEEDNLEIDNDLNGDDDELLLLPLTARNSIRVDINSSAKTTADVTALPRFQTARSLSVGACDKSKQNKEEITRKTEPATTTRSNNNITELQLSGSYIKDETINSAGNSSTNITIIEVTDIQDTRKTNGEIFQFPEVQKLQKTAAIANDYKCNVQIIPSNSSNNNNNNSTVKVLRPVIASNDNVAQVTTVHVAHDDKITTNAAPLYGTCYNATSARNSPLLPKRIILSANSSGITNITVNDKIANAHSDKDASQPQTQQKPSGAYYEKIFLSSSAPKAVSSQAHALPSGSQQASSSRVIVSETECQRQPVQTQRNTSRKDVTHAAENNYSTSTVSVRTQTEISNNALSPSRQATALPRETAETPVRVPVLLRGVTEAVITRPSRRDAHSAVQRGVPIRSSAAVNSRTKTNMNKTHTNNNDEANSFALNGAETQQQQQLRRSLMQQRRRSASTSDAQAQRNVRNSNNNELLVNNGMERSNNVLGLRMQPPPHAATDALMNSPKRMTLREQQVMQLRREIMHPGGVRLQLRRKDCVGSIAWVDCFNTVWISGWKQKEHPGLYNALHIGDQLLSIAGVAISTAAEANKIIRNANTLFVEVLIRRIPFGRVYAIRREREGQCLGLIRDGNTSTIVDVVPNSLAARHGLPPKAQTCDGSSFTFWVLTEINGRPLNLFFKDNEIRDRLNSVGRDISILVQPADLITKLKKQMKSLRGYKDYLVQ